MRNWIIILLSLAGCATGQGVCYFFDNPSHHVWQDDNTILEGRYFGLFKDDGSKEMAQKLAEVKVNADRCYP
jgi:hypothetical protein